MRNDIPDIGEDYMPRIADEILKHKIKTSGAVVIQGPKWCGKTTTAAHFASSSIKMDKTGSSNQYKMLADTEPDLLLDNEAPCLIDEWQTAPSLWNAIRAKVDERRKFGQFILTGSSLLKKMDKGTHSGTGRFSWMKMRPLSLYESKDSNGKVSLKDLFDGKTPKAVSNKLSLNDLAFLICRGGWPLAINNDKEIALSQAINYYDAVIMEDVIQACENDENEIKLDSERAKRVLRSYARNLSQQIPIETIRKDAIANDVESFSESSLYDYLSFLKRIFVIEDSAAWNPNLKSKSAIRTTETRYFSDPSIATAALGLGPNDLINDLETMGLFFENLAIRDLRVYADALDGEISHYRDSDGLECDAVIYLRNGKYGLIEIKLGSNAGIEEGIVNLNKLENKIDTKKMNKPSFKMVLIGKGDFAYRNNEGIDIVPIGCLRP